MTDEQWALRFLKTAAHEAGHAVAHERLGCGPVQYVCLEGLPGMPGRDGWCGRVTYENRPGRAGMYDHLCGVAALAGLAAELRLTRDSAALSVAEIRRRARTDVPDGATDALLHSFWLGAVDFVNRNWDAILAVGRALIDAPDPQRIDGGVVTHILTGPEVRKALEQAA
jgi:hypothetical protein